MAAPALSSWLTMPQTAMPTSGVNATKMGHTFLLRSCSIRSSITIINGMNVKRSSNRLMMLRTSRSSTSHTVPSTVHHKWLAAVANRKAAAHRRSNFGEMI